MQRLLGLWCSPGFLLQQLFVRKIENGCLLIWQKNGKTPCLPLAAGMLLAVQMTGQIMELKSAERRTWTCNRFSSSLATHCIRLCAYQAYSGAIHCRKCKNRRAGRRKSGSDGAQHIMWNWPEVYSVPFFFFFVAWSCLLSLQETRTLLFSNAQKWRAFQEADHLETLHPVSVTPTQDTWTHHTGKCSTRWEVLLAHFLCSSPGVRREKERVWEETSRLLWRGSCWLVWDRRWDFTRGTRHFGSAPQPCLSKTQFLSPHFYSVPLFSWFSPPVSVWQNDNYSVTKKTTLYVFTLQTLLECVELFSKSLIHQGGLCRGTGIFPLFLGPAMYWGHQMWVSMYIFLCTTALHCCATATVSVGLYFNLIIASVQQAVCSFAFKSIVMVAGSAKSQTNVTAHSLQYTNPCIKLWLVTICYHQVHAGIA